MNDLKIYYLFNPEKNYYNDSDSDKIVSIKSFFKKYNNFDINIYKKFNKEIEKYTILEILVHYHTIGIKKKLICSHKSFYDIYPDFDIDFIKILCPETKNMEINDIFLFWTINNDKFNNISSIKNFYIKYPNFNIKKYKNDNEILLIINIITGKVNNEKENNEEQVQEKILNQDNNIDLLNIFINNELSIEYISYVNNCITKNYNQKKQISTSSDIKLAHIFVHFFKIGGGERYISNFNTYNNIFKETLFINKNYQNESLFDYNSEIIYYNDYEELNLILLNYDIIIDHQLYWFDIEISKKTFLNIPENQIIRIIHGVPIHFENIIPRNFYYSIEVYNETLSNNSWNNHIKIYNNIGVDTIKYYPKIFNNNRINIAIVGRINAEKIPLNFLKRLIHFLDHNNNYICNLYGLIDVTYEKYFKLYSHKNIIYHGIINPQNINDIYLNNEILLHPSLSEAGATVILEAMSYGLPVICRNVGGLPNAIYNSKQSLCNNENEMFEKILLINDKNYTEISDNNILKILNENNQKYLFTKLINEIKLIYDYEKNTDKIPNIIHYIYGLKKQTEEFQFVYYLSILSNFLINKPLVIYFHYQYLPYGYWWDKAKKYIKLNFINTSDIYWNNKKIIKFAHKADKIRLDILLKYGGVYMDIDTITYKPYKDLLDYDFVIGLQEKNYNNEKDLYCNAILLSKKNSLFIKEWIQEYDKYFIPSGWCEASVHLPHIILNKIKNSNENIKILDQECFYYPSYNETDKIFENEGIINKNLITLHFWNTYSEKYYTNIKNFNWCRNNKSLYSLLMKNIIDIYESQNEYKSDDQDSISNIINSNIINSNLLINISIIIVYTNEQSINILNDIINQKYLYYLNIEIIIIDNGIHNFYDKYIDSEFKKDFIKKNIDIKIIDLNSTIEKSIAINIGIKYSKHNLIMIQMINENIHQNMLIKQCLQFNKMQENNKTFNILSMNPNNFKDIDNKDLIIDLNSTAIINNLLFDKEYVKYYLPNKNTNDLSDVEIGIYFTIINVLNNNFIKFNNIEHIENIENNYHIPNKIFINFKKFISDNITSSNNNIKPLYFSKILKLIINKYYDSDINYIKYISNIYNSNFL